VAFQPITSEWAQRHYREALTGGPVDRGRDEPATDAVSLELSGYIGMDEDEPLPVAAVHEHGDVAVGVQLEPGLGLVVGDLGGIAHVHIVAPARGIERSGRQFPETCAPWKGGAFQWV